MTNRSLIKLGFSILLIMAALWVGFVSFREYNSIPERLLSDFRSDLAAREFVAMYHASSESMKINVDEAEFVRRMKTVVDILAEYDSELMLERDVTAEQRIKNGRTESGDQDPDHYKFVILSIGKPEKRGRIFISWLRDGTVPRLFDLSIGDEPSLGNRINTLKGRPFKPGE